MTPAIISIRIRPATTEDAEKLRRALERMLLDDPSLHVLAGADAGDVVLGGISDRHLEIAIDCLHREAGVNATVGRPEVMYREAVTRAANGECKHATQTAGRGEYAHVKVHMYAAPPGGGCAIENRIAGGEIPDMFVEAVERGSVSA